MVLINIQKFQFFNKYSELDNFTKVLHYLDVYYNLMKVCAGELKARVVASLFSFDHQ